MILIDSRQGSKEFKEIFTSNFEPTLCQLEFGDFAFTGNGPDGPIFIGVERKTIPDLTHSVRSGRLQSHQLPGMIKTFDRSYLLIEGITKPDEHGLITSLIGKGHWQSVANAFGEKELQNLLVSLEEFAGIRVIHSSFQKDSAKKVQWLYQYWNKPYMSHTAHLAIKKVSGIGHKIDLVSPNLITRVAAQLPGVGIKRARDIAKRIKTIRDLASTPKEVWATFPGIGEKTAEKIVQIIEKGEGKNAR